MFRFLLKAVTWPHDLIVVYIYVRLLFRAQNICLSAVHRKLALLVSFCVRKVDFPALVR